MRNKPKFIALALLALVGASSLGGCIVVPDDGYYGHRHHDDRDHDGDRDGGRGGDRDWR
jgi:hypothetical protein